MPKKSGSFFVLAAASLWGTTGTSQALAPSGATPPVIGALRLIVGGAVLTIYALARREISLSVLRNLPRRALLGAVLCMAAYQVLFFGGVARTGVAVGTIVGIGSSPILGGLIGFFFAGESPRLSWVVATLLSILGVGLLAASGAGGEMQIDLFGVLMAVAAGGSYAAFTLFNKRLLANNRPAPVQAAVFTLSALLLCPLLFTSSLAWMAQPAGVLVTLHLGLVTVGLAYSLFAIGLRDVRVSSAVTLTLAEPLTAGILGVLVLGETLTLQAGLGILLIFSGLVVLSVTSMQSSA
jgi:drug/metabolite transporter, DME family